MSTAVYSSKKSKSKMWEIKSSKYGIYWHCILLYLWTICNFVTRIVNFTYISLCNLAANINTYWCNNVKTKYWTKHTTYPWQSDRVAKCHGYDGYIRVRIFAGWGKKSGTRYNLAKLSLLWEDLHNYARYLCTLLLSCIRMCRWNFQFNAP